MSVLGGSVYRGVCLQGGLPREGSAQPPSPHEQTDRCKNITPLAVSHELALIIKVKEDPSKKSLFLVKQVLPEWVNLEGVQWWVGSRPLQQHSDVAEEINVGVVEDELQEQRLRVLVHPLSLTQVRHGVYKYNILSLNQKDNNRNSKVPLHWTDHWPCRLNLRKQICL